MAIVAALALFVMTAAAAVRADEATVFAAASLTNAMEGLGQALSGENGGGGALFLRRLFGPGAADRRRCPRGRLCVSG